MKRSRLFFALALSLFSVTTSAVFAQETAKPQGTPQEVAPAKPAEITATPEELAEGKARLAATIKAHGGPAFLSMKGFSLTGKGETQQPGAGTGPGLQIPLDSVTLTAIAPDRLRLDLSTLFGDIAIVLPGGKEKGFLTVGGQVQDAPAQLALGDPTQLLRDAFTKEIPAKPLPDTIDGKPVTAFDNKTALKGFTLIRPGLAPVEVWTDADGYARKIVTTGPENKKSIVFLGDYKKVEEIALPGSMVVRQDKIDLLTFTFEKMKLSPVIPDNFFKRP